jgi:hypothetical protein
LKKTRAEKERSVLRPVPGLCVPAEYLIIPDDAVYPVVESLRVVADASRYLDGECSVPPSSISTAVSASDWSFPTWRL